jgi:hypothetical protein
MAMRESRGTKRTQACSSVMKAGVEQQNTANGVFTRQYVP